MAKKISVIVFLLLFLLLSNVSFAVETVVKIKTFYALETYGERSATKIDELVNYWIIQQRNIEIINIKISADDRQIFITVIYKQSK